MPASRHPYGNIKAAPRVWGSPRRNDKPADSSRYLGSDSNGPRVKTTTGKALAKKWDKLPEVPKDQSKYHGLTATSKLGGGIPKFVDTKTGKRLERPQDAKKSKPTITKRKK